MIVYMDSKTFRKHFINKVNDDEILEASYIIVSSRIHKHDSVNYDIVIGNNMFYPEMDVLKESDIDMVKYLYFKQCNEAASYIAMMIYQSLVNHRLIILLSNVEEMKTRYLEFLAEFIEMSFKYPVLTCDEYHKYRSRGIEPVPRCDKRKLIKVCQKLIDEDKLQKVIYHLQNANFDIPGRDKVVYRLLMKHNRRIVERVASMLDIDYIDRKKKKYLAKEIVEELIENQQEQNRINSQPMT